MTDLDYIQKVQMAWPRRILARDTEASAAIALQLVEEGLSAFPDCAKLLCMKGDLIQLSDGTLYKLADARRCYEQAIELAPESPEAYESPGFFFDAIESDPGRAEIAFRRAAELGGGPHTYAGLARVLSGQGHNTEELLAMLDACPHALSPPVQEMRSELLQGAWKPIFKK